MPQARNSGRNASLDQKKARAAGRQRNPLNPKGDLPLGATVKERKAAGGASGRPGLTKRGTKGSAQTRGGGGGGAAHSIPKD